MSLEKSSDELQQFAVDQAKAAARAQYLGWRHLRSEYVQNIDTVLATIETKGPWTWTLPGDAMASAPTEGDVSNAVPSNPHDEVLTYVSATNMDEIRQQYVAMRKTVELWDWISMTDIRSSWYMLTHGVGSLTEKPLNTPFEVESVTLFPIGLDGILGEVQIGALANERINRWPEVPSDTNKMPLPAKRLQATLLHNQYLDALRAQDTAGIIATMRPNVATAIRSYLGDDYTVVNAEGSSALADYYDALFERFTIKEIRVVNRVVETWFIFAELHWIVEYRTGARTGQTYEFCTADVAPIDSDCKFWVRTGAGTSPVLVDLEAFDTYAPFSDERGVPERQGWEFTLVQRGSN
jgi:hypothetical protein